MSAKRARIRRRVFVFWTERAVGDLETIEAFIAADNPRAARRSVRVLMAVAARAGRAPMAGRRVPEVGRDDVRELLERTYRIVYRVTRERVEILTIFEGHRRFPSSVLNESE